MLLKLKVTEGSNTGQEIIITKEKFLIGRADDCNLRPHSDAISRRHCVIINRGKVVGVRDLKSRNGTLVNGKKITADKRLRSGDTLEVGPLKFEVSLEALPSEVAKKEKSTKAKVAASDAGSADDMSGMVNSWLEEADGVARDEQRMETREYRFDDTNSIEVKKETQAERKAAKVKAKEEAEKQGPGKLPKFEVKKEEPKDTQEAAQMVLRKLFNRS